MTPSLERTEDYDMICFGLTLMVHTYFNTKQTQTMYKHTKYTNPVDRCLNTHGFSHSHSLEVLFSTTVAFIEIYYVIHYVIQWYCA